MISNPEGSPISPSQQQEYLSSRNLERHAMTDAEAVSREAATQGILLVDTLADIVSLVKQSAAEGVRLNTTSGNIDQVEDLGGVLDPELEAELLEAQDSLGDDIGVLREISQGRLDEFTSQYRYIMRLVDDAHQKLTVFAHHIKYSPQLRDNPMMWRKLEEGYENIRELQESLDEDIGRASPEAFMANQLLKLREYKRELATGIVETPYVTQLKLQMEQKLQKNGILALVGETGTGKTQIAKKIARAWNPGKDFQLVRGHAMMDKSELLSYLGIKVDREGAENVPVLIDQAKQKYRETYPGYDDLDDQTKAEHLAQIEEVVTGQSASTEMKTEQVYAEVLMAAENGQIVIIDEFNFIPPGLLASLNELIQAKPGQRISVGGREIVVQEGFGFIFTGNVTTASTKRYLERQELDPATLNRFNSGLIKYNGLPQDMDASLVASIQESPEVADQPLDRDLFAVGLAHLSDSKGNIRAPQGALDQVWRLSQCFAYFQKKFAGEDTRDIDSQVLAESDPIFDKYNPSMRTFGSILSEWKKGYEKDIDYFIFDNLIRPASVVVPQEAAAFFNFLKERGEFFRGPDWQTIKVDTQDWSIRGVEAVSSSDPDAFKNEERLYPFSPQEVAEALSGYRMPAYQEVARSGEGEDLATEGRGANLESLRELAEMQKMIEETDKKLQSMSELIGYVCQQEQEVAS